MEEYVWISKAAHHPVFTDRAHPILRRLADHYSVEITVEGPDDTATEPYVKAVFDAMQRNVAGMMVIGWGNDEMVPAIDAAVNSGIPVVCVDSAFFRNQIPHMTVGGQDIEVLAQVFADRLRLCRRFNNDEIF